MPSEGGQEGGYRKTGTMQEKDDTGSIVRATARPEPDPDDPREWSWVGASVWTDRDLTISIFGKYARVWSGVYS
jgi:hypothetical protein